MLMLIEIEIDEKGLFHGTLKVTVYPEDDTPKLLKYLRIHYSK